MAWIKRNLPLVITGLVAVVLLGVAGYYLFAQFQDEATVSEELKTQADALGTLVGRPVHPGNKKVDNIKATTEQAKRLETEFIKPARKFFTSLDPSNTIQSAQFQLAMVNAIADLRRQATNVGVGLPNQYAFSFSSQERTLRFDAKSLAPLMMELQDIRAICSILFQARIHKLLSIKRVAVATNEPQDGADYLPKSILSIRTNEVTGIVAVPYQIDAVGHSQELASVLNGFARAGEFFVVKVADIQPYAPEETNPDGTPVTGSGYMPGRPGMMDPLLMQRYGLAPGGGRGGTSPDMMRRYGMGGAGGAGSRYGGGMRGGRNPYMPPVVGVDPTAAGQGQIQTGPFLKESTLRMILLVDALKLGPPPAAAPAPPPAETPAETPADPNAAPAN